MSFRPLAETVNAGNTLEVTWNGPFGWPGYDQIACPLPNICGVYLWTVDYDQGGYLIYAAGLTRRPLPKRFREHTRAYLTGVYHILDIRAMQAGTRELVWEGFWMKKPRSTEKQHQFEHQRPHIETAAKAQLAGFRIFVAHVGTEPRLLERLEAAIMQCLYDQPAPISTIPDHGMRLTPRWPTEEPIIVANRCDHALHGLSPALWI